MKSKLFLASIIALTFSTLSSAEVTQGPFYQIGVDLAHSCAGCHGLTGISPVESNPNLAGQKQGYLEYALKAYRSGDRKGGMAMIMYPNARGLSDDEIQALALYFSSQKSQTGQ